MIEQHLLPHKAGDTINQDKFESVMESLSQMGLVHILKPWFRFEFQKQLRAKIIPDFWCCFESTSDLSPRETQDAFLKAVTDLHCTIHEYESSALFIESTETDHAARTARQDFEKTSYMDAPLSRTIHDLLRALLLSSIPCQFNRVLLKFYTAAFRAFHKAAGDEDEDESPQCAGCELDFDSCQCDHLLESFHDVNRKLHELQLLDAMVRDAVSTVAYKYIEHHVQSTCRGNFESRFLESLEKWLNTTVMEWFYLVYKNQADDETKVALASLKEHLLYFLYDTYVTVRMDQLFNIIIEFPESLAAVEDLRECLEKTNLKSKVIHSLKSSMEKRLLHPGVDTNDILTAYISAIKALRILDSTGYILQLVCEPVCQYLRTREDTVKCIVSNLTDESCVELAGELVKFTPITLEDTCPSDEDDEDWEHWQPAPVGNDQVQVSKGTRSSDIVSMLVNIYGSKELFASEYQTLLAERLLAPGGVDTEREVRYLECLKLRFGEAQLHSCEVMLRDVADSKRLHANLASGAALAPADFDVSATIISAQFWPSLKDEKLVVPPAVQAALDRYTKAFEAVKGNRTLHWKPHLGQVDLEVDTGSRVLQLSVSPIHATVIYLFQDKARWTLDELSGATHVSGTMLRRKLALWQGHGLLREDSPGVFTLCEEGQGGPSGTLAIEVEGDEDDDEAHSVMASTQDQKESDLQMYWSYIVGMLTNLEMLTLERIHTMLKMFAMQTPSTTELTVQELRLFLDSQVAKQKLLYSGGHYRLPKADLI